MVNKKTLLLSLGLSVCTFAIASNDIVLDEVIDDKDLLSNVISEDPVEATAEEEAEGAVESEETTQSCVVNALEIETPKMHWADANIANMESDAKMDALKRKYGYYLPLQEFEITPIPLVAFGFIAKANKQNFRAARNNFIPSYKNRIDDWLQHVPLLMTTGFNLAGYEGRSKLGRYLVSAGMSYAVMAAIVNGVKYTAKEMRPDGSTANSFPSGHTATAFVAATILHKEYGQTRSPWWSVAGYGIATTTGIMRTLNNRHWISDILVGAGIGVLSTDLGYMIGDLICKDKWQNRPRREGMSDMLKTPSFFRFSLGMQFFNDLKMPINTEYITTARLWAAPGSASLQDDYYTIMRNGNPFRIPDDFNADKKTFANYANSQPSFDEGAIPTIKVSTGTSVSAEGAYFINNYVGVGARARITTAPVVAEGLYCYSTNLDGSATYRKGTSASDVWSVADVGVGVYGAWPISSRHNVGAKILYGRRFFGELDLQAVYDQSYVNTVTGERTNTTFYGDDLWIDKSNADNFTIGLHYTYSTGSGIAISCYADYDYSKPEFDVNYVPYNNDVHKMLVTQSSFSYNQKIRSFNIGASMVVMF